MPQLKNARHEAFCIYVAEGKYQSEAYKLAGYKPKDDANARKSASELVAKPHIRARIAELSREITEERIKAAVALNVTPHLIIHDLFRFQRKAEQRGNLDAAIRATTEIARVAGLYKSAEGHQGAVHLHIHNRTPNLQEQREIAERRQKRIEMQSAKLLT